MKKFEKEKDEPIATIEKLVEVVLDEADLKKIVLVCALLSEVEQEELVNFLKMNENVFA